MDLLDLLDEDELVVASRKPRPHRMPLSEVWECLESDGSIPTPLDHLGGGGGGASTGMGSSWYTLEEEVLSAMVALRAGDFPRVLRCSSSAFAALLGPVEPVEWEEVPSSNFATPELVAASGGLPDPGDFKYMCGTLFPRRLARWVLSGEGDEFFLDAAGSTDTPRHWRATLAALVGAACLGLYTRGNFTGPEIEEGGEELQGLHPLPFAASLLPLPSHAEGGAGSEITASSSSSSSTLSPQEGVTDQPTPLSITSRRQWILEEEAGGDGSGSAGATSSSSSSSSSFPLDPPPTPLHAASLRLLSPTALGDAAYPHIHFPHYLATARVLLGALARPVEGGLIATVVGGGSGSSSSAPSHGMVPARLSSLYATTDALPGISRLAGRACTLSLRSLLGGGKGVGGGINLLWTEVAGLYARAAVHLCPQYSGSLAFSAGDVFRHSLVAKELAESGSTDRAFGDREEEEEEEEKEKEKEFEVKKAGAAASIPPISSSSSPSSSTVPPPNPYLARFLLEWGIAQHSFGKCAGAKTSFFLAKRESGLRTLLTGVAGKRTKHQSFFTAQLVLKATSVGELKAAAVAQKGVAVVLGAAEGRVYAEESAAMDAARAAAAAAKEARKSGGGEGSGEVEVEGEAPPLPEPPRRSVLGGLREVAISEVDSSTDLLEATTFFDPGNAAEMAASDATRNELFYSKGWGAALEKSIAASAASATASGSSASNSSSAVAAAGGEGQVASLPSPPPLQDGPVCIVDQCIILALCLDVKNHSPSGGLTNEEMRPYVARVLDNPLNWSVHSQGLYVRALLEWENHRTADRAAVQMGALVDAAENSGARKRTVFNPRGVSNAGAGVGSVGGSGARTSHAHLLPLPALWEMKRGVGEKYLALGFVRDALHVFSELGLWEEVLNCLVLLEKSRKAESLLKALLHSPATPTTTATTASGSVGKVGDASRWKLLCSLSSLMGRDSEYLQAWEESKGTYGPAALSLARYSAGKGSWSATASFLRAGLKVCPGDSKGWFLQGVVCMREGGEVEADEGEDSSSSSSSRQRRVAALESACGAFSRVVQLDATRADAWANLGSLHLRLGAWERGYGALEQAMKADKSDWRIVSNFITAAVRVGAWGRAIRAQTTLLTMAVAGGRGEDGEEGSVTEGGVDIAALTTTAKVVLDAVWAHRKEVAEKQECAAAAKAEAEAAATAIAAAAAAGGTLPLSAPPSSTAATTPPPSLFPAFSGSLDFAEDGEPHRTGGGGAVEGDEGGGKVTSSFSSSTTTTTSTHNHILLEPLARLLSAVTSKVRPPPTVWAVFADVEDARGNHGEAHACRERQWRALISRAGWEKEGSGSGVGEVCSCTERLIELGGKLEAWIKCPKEWSEQAKYYIDTVVARVEAAVAAAAAAAPAVGAGEGAEGGVGLPSPLSRLKLLRPT